MPVMLSWSTVMLGGGGLRSGQTQAEPLPFRGIFISRPATQLDPSLAGVSALSGWCDRVMETTRGFSRDPSSPLVTMIGGRTGLPPLRSAPPPPLLRDQLTTLSILPTETQGVNGAAVSHAGASSTASGDQG